MLACCLKHARSLGLDCNLVSLCTFSSCGGAQYIAKELVCLFLSTSTSHEERLEQHSTQIPSFCEELGAIFEEALINYTKELCGEKNTSKRLSRKLLLWLVVVWLPAQNVKSL
jgi:hypothetical protein